MAQAKDDMIRFRCHRCKKRIAAPPGNVGKKVKCPGCQIVTIVPDIPSAAQATAGRVPPRTGSAPSRPSPPPAPPAPMDELEQLATVGYEEQYESYEQPSSYHAEPERPRGPRIKRSHLQWVSALGMSLHVLWILTLAMSIWQFVAFIINWNDANTMGAEVPTEVIINAFGSFFISLVFCFCCLTGAMACGMVRAMGRKMNTL